MTRLTDIQPLYLHRQNAANDAVTLHTGPAVLRNNAAKQASGAARLFLRFAPSANLRLELDLTTDNAFGAFEPGDRVKVEMADSVGEALVSGHRMRVVDGVFSLHNDASVSTFEIGSAAELTSAGFQVLNFVDFITPGPQPSPRFGYPPHTADLQAGGWRVRLSAVEKSKDIFNALGEAGGYAFTHLGLIERSDGARFKASDVDAFLNTLALFFSFARGAACSLPVRWGHAADEALAWQRWGCPIVDSWKSPHNWFEENHGNLLQEIFPAFLDAIADPELAEPFKLALHWYRSSNLRSGGMEGAIILGVTALELLSALVVVDRAKAFPEDEFDQFKAGKKLRKLLQTMRVPLGVPPQFDELSAFAKKTGGMDAAQTLTEIRHGYVHANKKRREVVLSVGNLATFQTWQLSLWYQELALLYFLNHAGDYRNRVTADSVGIVERVPWA